MKRLPAVSVVIATRDRPELLRRAVKAVLDQEYAGAIECVVVFDQAEPDHSLARSGERRSVVVVRNERTPGLAGARNTGVLVSANVLLAFCDDDDEWLPHKLTSQVEALSSAGRPAAVVSGVCVHYKRKRIARIPEAVDLTVEALARDRVFAAHPSTVLVRRAAFEAIGLVDEAIPGSYGEDYDWILRAAAHGPIAVVPEPLVTVLWGETSHFNGRWRTIAEALEYLLAKHPVLSEHPVGQARICGQIAFARAALGEAAAARRWARRAVRLSWRERRAYLALLVSVRLASAERILRLAHATGRGI